MIVQRCRNNDFELLNIFYFKSNTNPTKSKAMNSPMISHESKINPIKSPLYTPLRLIKKYIAISDITSNKIIPKPIHFFMKITS